MLIEKISLSNHRTFYLISYINYIEVVRLKEEREEFQAELKDKKTTDCSVDFLAKKHAVIQRYAMVVVIFSALTLEAIINHYAIENLSKSYLNNYLDKLDPVSKWIVIPKIVTGRQLDTDGQAFQQLKGLFRLRNQLVHYKTKVKRIDEVREEDWIREEEAENAIQTVWKVLEALSSLDQTVSIDWLKDSETDPFA